MDLWSRDLDTSGRSGPQAAESMMGDLIRSGHLVEAILVLTAVEWLALSAYHRLTGRGVPPRDFNRNLLSGMLLLLALREALVNGWWGWIAASLTGALVAHLADLGHRWIR